MNSQRYTSSALSERLRAAGLDQVVAGSDHWLLGVPGRAAFVPEIRNGGLRKVDVSAVGEANVARALRLDEVLEELHAAGLAVHWASSSKGAFASAIPSIRFKGRSNMAEHADAVEAAGLVLAQLLEARKGGGA